ncbi:2,4-dienoyl-CoA reductase [Pseudogracilibacillus auburnensis]|uniref:NAD(P)-dependent dehydrogenase (Short-subunit alcohol dehydrogenase family) n=1 Tax=Pseudogracilibacillus auburnensis TaxID=1494959 RepID=A0A2V3WB21_9BACI|nr:2,4-dienoyl-CoA reductase [Pseudogracilibacillus auburnensis]PXW90344.1 NAD(P)-dependent dehydrogenase (short-subunit alcohol dehydrogenase family) [Pseudogracilibacillus auburnensis]
MNNKTVIVTGGSSGMGKYMAKRFADEGANVVITGRKEERLQLVKEELLETATGKVMYVQMDVREPADVKRMVDEAVEEFGAIDHLVNNAAGNFIVAAEELSINGWNTVIDIVLNGTFYCSKAVGEYWIKEKRKGTILNMVATYAWDAGAGVIHSAAAKAGVLSLTRTLAVEWGSKYGIRVNAIAPGPIERTGGAEKLMLSPEMAERTRQSVPLKRFGKPEEIAGLACFLLSDDASYINGEVVTMDGGQWLNQLPF